MYVLIGCAALAVSAIAVIGALWAYVHTPSDIYIGPLDLDLEGYAQETEALQALKDAAAQWDDSRRPRLAAATPKAESPFRAAGVTPRTAGEATTTRAPDCHTYCQYAKDRKIPGVCAGGCLYKAYPHARAQSKDLMASNPESSRTP